MPRRLSKECIGMRDILLEEKAEFHDILSKKLDIKPPSVSQYFRTLQKNYMLDPKKFPHLKKFKHHKKKVESFTVYFVRRNERIVYEKAIERFPDLEDECNTIWEPLFGNNVGKDYSGRRIILKKEWAYNV